jgi:hypothetical protein
VRDECLSVMLERVQPYWGVLHHEALSQVGLLQRPCCRR